MHTCLIKFIYTGNVHKFDNGIQRLTLLKKKSPREEYKLLLKLHEKLSKEKKKKKNLFDKPSGFN